MIQRNDAELLTKLQLETLTGVLAAMMEGHATCSSIAHELVYSPASAEIAGRPVGIPDLIQMLLEYHHGYRGLVAISGLIMPLFQRIADLEAVIHAAQDDIFACSDEGCEQALAAEAALWMELPHEPRPLYFYYGEMDRYTGMARVCVVPGSDPPSDSGAWDRLPVRLDLLDKISDGDQEELNWGYGGSGPTALAISLLAHHLEDEARAVRLYRGFKREFVAKLLMGKPWVTFSSQLDVYVRDLEAK